MRSGRNVSMVINITLGRVMLDRLTPGRAWAFVCAGLLGPACPKAVTAVSVMANAGWGGEKSLNENVEKRRNMRLLGVLQLPPAPLLLACTRLAPFVGGCLV